MPDDIRASEHQEQTAFIAWMRIQHPGLLIFAIPNGAFLAGTVRQRAVQMDRLKAEGLTPGVPDLYVPALRLWIELKAAGGRVSGAQRAMHAYLRMIGDRVEVCEGADAARAAVTQALRAAGVGVAAPALSEVPDHA